MRTSARNRNASRRRAASYLFFLCVAVLVMAIGLSSLGVVGLELERNGRVADRAEARHLAAAAIEVAAYSMSAETTWRDTLAHDTWTGLRSLGRGGFRWKVIDEADGDLTTGRNGVVRAYGEGRVGDAVWIYSAEVQPPLETIAGNLLANPGFETGTASPWTSRGDASLSAVTDERQAGSYSLFVDNGSDPPRARQTVAAKLADGTALSVAAWARVKSNASDIEVGLWITDDTGTSYVQVARVANVEQSWTYIGGEITLDLRGGLAELVWEVSGSAAEDFYLDETSLAAVSPAPVIGPLRGSWRREAQ